MEIQWSLVIFTLLTGSGGWLMAAAAGNELSGGPKRDPALAIGIGLALVVSGGLASVTHLSHPTRMMNALANPVSGIFVEATLVGIVVVCGLVQIYLIKRKSIKPARVATVLSGIFGIVISFMAGESYTVMASQAAWDTLLLPSAYLATAAPVGIALYWALPSPEKEASTARWGKATAAAGAAGAVVCAAYSAAACLFVGLTAPISAATIVFDIACAALGFAGSRKQRPVFAWAAIACATAAALLLRILMWVAGTEVYGFFGQ